MSGRRRKKTKRVIRQAVLLCLCVACVLTGCLLAVAAKYVVVYIVDGGRRGEITVNTPDPQPKTEDKTSGEDDGWLLTLVNPWNMMDEDYEPPELTKLKNGQSVDSRCYPDLQKMMDDCRAAGCKPLICSSYRTWDKQQSLYDKKVNYYLSTGLSREKAEAEAGKVVAVPGTSEHQLGLAVDIVDVDYQLLDEGQEKTETQKWLMENSWKYGFILRYPPDKGETTGIIYEPWHYRYVGLDAAKEIYEQGVCLEEYLDSINTK